MPKIRQRRTKSNSGIMSLLGPELTDKEFVMLTVQGYIETYSKYKLTMEICETHRRKHLNN